jgi:hypothetical protein
MSQAESATLAGAIDDLIRRGFTEHFGVAADNLRALESGKTFRAKELTIREYRRFEGVSDPDDMSIVYAIESRSGTRGLERDLVVGSIRAIVQLYLVGLILSAVFATPPPQYSSVMSVVPGPRKDGWEGITP